MAHNNERLPKELDQLQRNSFKDTNANIQSTAAEINDLSHA